MTHVISISDLRNSLSDYLFKVKLGDSLVIKDEKKDEEIAEIIPRKKFDQKKYAASYKRMLKNLKGISAKDHPEWATRAKVEKWLRQTRMNAERSFDVPPGQ